jgi:hypothetical protein
MLSSSHYLNKDGHSCTVLRVALGHTQAPMMGWSGSPLGQLSPPRRAGRAEPRTKRENLKSPHPSVDPDRSGSDLLGLNKSGGGFQQWVRLKAGADAENVGGVKLSRVFPPPPATIALW